MKEELKAGKDIPGAIDEGFKRAWPSIRDSNLNSLIVCEGGIDFIILFL